MTKAKPVPPRPFVPASKLVWDDDRLSALSKEQLANLLSNLPAQVEIGRISEETAQELEGRIRLRLPAPKKSSRRKRPQASPPEAVPDDHKGIATEK